MKVNPITTKFCNAQMKPASKSSAYGAVSFGQSNRINVTPPTAVDTSSLKRTQAQWRDFAISIDKNFKNKDKVNIIYQACQDGFEPYALAIALIKTLGEDGAKKFLPIMAGDIDSGITKAQEKTLEKLDAKEIETLEKSGINFDTLKNSVIFESRSAAQDLRELDDNSNTVFIFRNVIKCLSDYSEFMYALKAAPEKLKPGSILYLSTVLPGSKLQQDDLDAHFTGENNDGSFELLDEKESGIYRKRLSLTR